MQPEKNEFIQPMQPWTTLAKHAKHTNLPDLGIELFYYEAGVHQSQHLLMVHGLGDEADTWRHVLLPLAQKYHVFAIDLPGFGRSDKPEVDYTPQFMMRSLLGFLDQLEINRVILMGSSLGAILAQGIALAQPEPITGMILVGGALYQEASLNDWFLRMMQIPLLGEWLYTRLRKDPKAAFNSLNNVYHQLENLPEKDRKFLYTRVNQRVWSDGQRRCYFSTLRNLSPWIKHLHSDLTNQLKLVDMPTLILRGESDSLFLDSQADAIVNIQPNATKATIKGAGHLPHQEKPDLFIEIALQWLESNF